MNRNDVWNLTHLFSLFSGAIDACQRNFVLSARTLKKSPGFTLVATLTLIIGIGANTVIFSLVNSILLKPGPGTRLDEIVTLIRIDGRGREGSGHSYQDILDYRRQSKEIFTGIAAYGFQQGSIQMEGRTHRASLGIVTDNYFSLLGIHPRLGSIFIPSDESPAVVMISEAFWKRNFNSDPAICGHTVSVNNQICTIVGVVPEEAARIARVVKIDAFIPFQPEGQDGVSGSSATSRQQRNLISIARLKPHVTLERAQVQCATIGQRLFEEYPEMWTRDGKQVRLNAIAEPTSRIPVEGRNMALGLTTMLFVVVGLVLLIVCANLGSFFLARGFQRRSEIAIRLALGAKRSSIIVQLLTESLLLSLLGAAGGIVLTFWITRVLAQHTPQFAEVPIILDVQVDTAVLLFTILIAVITSVLFGLVPALQSTRVDLVPALKGVRSFLVYRFLSHRNMLIMAQVAASLVILIGAGVFLRNLMNAYQVELGFNPNRIAYVSADLQTRRYSEQQALQFYERVLDRLRVLPGVQMADASHLVPMSSKAEKRSFAPEEKPELAQSFVAQVNTVGPQYFDILDIPIRLGRSFTKHDRLGASRVAIINELVAQRFWPNQNPIGKRVLESNGQSLEVVGVAAASKYNTPDEETWPYVYLPWHQNYRSTITFSVKCDADPGKILNSVCQELEKIDKDLPLFDIRTAQEQVNLALLPYRLATAFLSGLAILALGLSAVGLYGAMAFAAAQRTHEIGIRIALGAQTKHVIQTMMRDGIVLTSIGALIGLITGTALAHITASQLSGIKQIDPFTLALVTAVLMGVTLLACFLPARRAAKGDPIKALRCD